MKDGGGSILTGFDAPAKLIPVHRRHHNIQLLFGVVEIFQIEAIGLIGTI